MKISNNLSSKIRKLVEGDSVPSYKTFQKFQVGLLNTSSTINY